VQTLGGPPEVQLLGNGNEIPQLPQLNRKIHCRAYCPHACPHVRTGLSSPVGGTARRRAPVGLERRLAGLVASCEKLATTAGLGGDWRTESRLAIVDQAEIWTHLIAARAVPTAAAILTSRCARALAG